MAKSSRKFSLVNLFRSNVISTTNPRQDTADFLDKPKKDIPPSSSLLDLDGSDIVNIGNVVQAVRSREFTRDSLYQEYRDMDQEVIIQSALKSYADDATVIDNTRGTIVWLDGDDDELLGEIEEFFRVIDVESKIWSWVYQVAQFGDKYIENKFNKKGYLIDIRDVKHPEFIYDIVEDGQHEGYVVKRDPRLNKYNTDATIYSDIDLYGPGKFTHMYLSDNPNEETLIIDVYKDHSYTELSYAELEVVRGNSTIESVRTINRILRLLEDTIITNKIARAEYVRIFNIEAGDTTGQGTRGIVSRFKRMFDSRPRFDGTTGEYNSTRNYRPAADAVFNAVHNGHGAVDVKEMGGDIETRWMSDLEYFRDKMFTGLQIPKAYMGFDQNLGALDGGSNLARLDIRYSRTVRRIQSVVKKGLQDLVDLWLASRHRESDIGKVTVMMQNPSSAEEMNRLQELVARLDTINKIAESLNNVANGIVNLPQLYYELVTEFIDIPSIRRVFEDLLAKAIIIKHIQINTHMSEVRTQSVLKYQEMGKTIDSLTGADNNNQDVPDSDSDIDDDFDAEDSGFGESDSFEDVGDLDTPSGGPSLSSGSDFSLSDNSSEPDLELGSLSDSNLASEPTSSYGNNELLDSYRPKVTSKVLETYLHGNKTKSELLDDLIMLSLNAPKEYRKDAERIAERLSTEGFTKDNIDSAYELFDQINQSLTKSGITSSKLIAVTETLKNPKKRVDTAKVLEELIK